jgi:hypothetical protein
MRTCASSWIETIWTSDFGSLKRTCRAVWALRKDVHLNRLADRRVGGAAGSFAACCPADAPSHATSSTKSTRRRGLRPPPLGDELQHRLQARRRTSSIPLKVGLRACVLARHVCSFGAKAFALRANVARPHVTPVVMRVGMNGSGSNPMSCKTPWELSPEWGGWLS